MAIVIFIVISAAGPSSAVVSTPPPAGRAALVVLLVVAIVAGLLLWRLPDRLPGLPAGMPAFAPRHSWLGTALDAQGSLVMPVARLAALAAALALCLSGEWYAGGRGPAGVQLARV